MIAGRLRVLLVVAVGVGWLLVAMPSHALEGRVIDGSTGKPLPGVYVIGAWEVVKPMFGKAISGCAKLELTRTDEQGKFTLSNWSGSVLAHLFGGEDLNIYYYLRGYLWENGHAQIGEPAVLVPDTRPAIDRLGHLNELTAKADCGSRSERMKYALPLYRLMYAEAATIASKSNQEERKALSNILFMIELLELGYKQADANAQSRFLRGYP